MCVCDVCACVCVRVMCVCVMCVCVMCVRDVCVCVCVCDVCDVFSIIVLLMNTLFANSNTGTGSSFSKTTFCLTSINHWYENNQLRSIQTFTKCIIIKCIVRPQHCVHGYNNRYYTDTYNYYTVCCYFWNRFECRLSRKNRKQWIINNNYNNNTSVRDIPCQVEYNNSSYSIKIKG